MPAVPAIIAVVGTVGSAVISAKMAADANKRAIQANKDTTTQAIDYEKEKNDAYQKRYDAARVDYNNRLTAHYKRFYGFDPNEGSTPAAAPAQPTPVAPAGPAPGPTPSLPAVGTPVRLPGGVQQQGTYLQQPAGGKPQLNGYGQPPPMDINAIVGAGAEPAYNGYDPSRYFNQPIAKIQPWSFTGNSGEPPAPTGPGLPGQQPMDWNDWAKYGVGSPLGR